MICDKSDCKVEHEDYWVGNWKTWKMMISPAKIKYVVILFGTLILMWGWYGFALALLLDWMLHLEGGPVLGHYKEYKEYTGTKCIAGNEHCHVCDENGNLIK